MAQKRYNENKDLLSQYDFITKNIKRSLIEEPEHKTGDLNEEDIVNYKFDDHIFYQWEEQIIFKQKGTVIGILLDQSGSMLRERVQLCMRLGYILAHKFEKTKNKMLIHGYNDVGRCCHLYEYYNYSRAKFSFKNALGGFKYDIIGKGSQKDAQAILTQSKMIKSIMKGTSRAFQFIISDTKWIPSSREYSGKALAEVIEQIDKNHKLHNIQTVVIGIDAKQNEKGYPWFIPVLKDNDNTYRSSVKKLVIEIMNLINN